MGQEGVEVALLKRVLIGNRGEIAIRIAKAASALGVDSVGVYAPVDSLSLHTRFTTEARQIGGLESDCAPAPEGAGLPGPKGRARACHARGAARPSRRPP